MLRKKISKGIGIRVNETYECKTLIQQLREHKQGGEKVENGRAKIMHNEKKEGVIPAGDIRYDHRESMMLGLHEVAEGFKANEEINRKKAMEAEAKAMEIAQNEEAGR